MMIFLRFVCALLWVLIAAVATAQDMPGDAESEMGQPPQQRLSPFAPFPASSEPKPDRLAVPVLKQQPVQYRLAGIVTGEGLRSVVIELPGERFQVLDLHQKWAGLKVLAIHSHSVMLETVAGKRRLFIQ